MAFISEPTAEDVANRVNHDYPPEARDQVMAILAGARDFVGGVEWQQFAALRGALGKVHLLQQWVDRGNKDYRDLKLAIEGLAGSDWERSYILYEERENRKPRR